MDEMEEYGTWLKSYSEEGVKEELKNVLADIEELEWRAKHGYIYDSNVLLILRQQLRFLNTRMEELVIKDVKRKMEDHKRDLDTLIEQINKGLTKHLENKVKGDIQEFHDSNLLKFEKLVEEED